jgi:DNA-binding MarR family transcriptional regulator
LLIVHESLAMKRAYLETVSLVERLHRHFLEVVKVAIDGLGVRDINNVQVLILYNIAHDEMTVGELTQRGYYLGSNVSYNLKKLIEHGYIAQARSQHDRRSVRIKLTALGLSLHRKLDAVFEMHARDLDRAGTGEGLANACESLRRLERFWDDQRLGATAAK